MFSEAAGLRHVVPAAIIGAAGLISATLSITDANNDSYNNELEYHAAPHNVSTTSHAQNEQKRRQDIATTMPLPSLLSFAAAASSTMTTSCDFFAAKPRQTIRRRRTLKRMKDTKTRDKLEQKYTVQWNRPLGEGGFGSVYLGTDKRTGELVAIKKISKQYTNDTSFQQEMNAFHQIRSNGNHPNICGLRENFDEGQYFYLVMDLISGGEVFDRLIEQGAYSEADAARLVREVGSALAFLHGIGLVHGDLVRLYNVTEVDVMNKLT